MHSMELDRRLKEYNDFGNKVNNCVKCGKWCPSNRTQAFLCNDCGFGNKKQNCIKCGKWCP